ncbi:MAG: glycosyltransferase family 2 protein [Verrucomicrobia bacterium]|nr:glycosyltransferase family 2 protein [Verrucomicrobiota bacterium]MBV8278723.1 glycosyltransferase family 2 protein [Verrucomicrobiota bacterium]
MIEPIADTVCAIIPAHEEERFIAEVVRAVRAHVTRVIVVDDHSQDKTGLAAATAGASVIRHPQRLGKGAAIKTGLRRAAAGNYEYFLFLDGDGQHDPSEIPKFVDRVSQSKTDLLVGNRMSNPVTMPWVRRLTNRFMSWQIGNLCRRKLPDSQCGYRMASRRLLSVLLRSSDGFAFETECLLLAARDGYSIDFVPIRSIYRAEQSKIRPARDTLGYFQVLWKHFRQPVPVEPVQALSFGGTEVSDQG